MTSIVKAKAEDLQLLADIGRISFIESHGRSAAPEEIDRYVKEKYTYEFFKTEISDPKNIYHIIYHDGQAAGYSKIIFNATQASIQMENVTKLERFYLLQAFYGLKLGLELFQFNLELSRQNRQSGMWLYTWKENRRAIDFYLKNNFNIVGSYDFKLTETHANPNHLMFLEYSRLGKYPIPDKT